jgi:hypothetical protein
MINSTPRSAVPNVGAALDFPISIAAILLVVLGMLHAYAHIQQDDNYIFYSYADNLVSGHGYVFNAGERINATTSPLYTLLLAAGSFILGGPFGLGLPAIGHLIGAASLVITGVCLLVVFARDGGALYPCALPLVFLMTPLLPNSVGMETFLTLALATVSLASYARGTLVAAAFWCGLAILARPDMVLLAGTLAVYDSVRHRRLPPLGAWIVLVIPPALWLGFSHLYFGALVPTSLSAKLGQTESGRWGSGLIFLRGLLDPDIWQGTAPRGLTWALLLVGVCIAVVKVRQWPLLRHPVLHIIILWNLLYLAVYGLILNPPAYPWYYTPLSLGIAVIATLPVEGLYATAARRLRHAHIARPVAVSILACIALLPALRASGDPVTAKYENYRLAAEWLNANVPHGSSVGANEIGVLRYYYRKGTVIDALGLTTPLVAEQVRRRNYDWYVHHFTPDYLMFNHPHRPLLEDMVKEAWFKEEYALRTLIRTPRRAVAIYGRRKPAAPLPAAGDRAM